MKYLYGLAITVIIVVGVALCNGRESYVEPAQSVLITNLEHIKGLTRIEVYCEQ